MLLKCGQEIKKKKKKEMPALRRFRSVPLVSALSICLSCSFSSSSFGSLLPLQWQPASHDSADALGYDFQGGGGGVHRVS